MVDWFKDVRACKIGDFLEKTEERSMSEVLCEAVLEDSKFTFNNEHVRFQGPLDAVTDAMKANGEEYDSAVTWSRAYGGRRDEEAWRSALPAKASK